MSASRSVWPVPGFEPSASLCAHLLRMARYLSRGLFDPEDLVQEVITSALARFSSGAPLPSRGIEPMLFVSLRNAVITQVRRMQVRERAERQLAAEGASVDAPDEVIPLPAWRTTSDQELEAAMRSLSPGQREVFVAVTRGERYASIAARLGITEGAVAKRAFDARQRLRRRLRLPSGRGCFQTLCPVELDALE